MRARALAAAVWLCALPAPAHEGSDDLGLPPLSYELPVAGSYELPPIDRVREHVLRDPEGEPGAVLGLEAGQCALVSFVYTHCTDASGCPLSLASLQRLDRALAAREDLGPRVRLVTVSFDPERDDPE